MAKYYFMSSTPRFKPTFTKEWFQEYLEKILKKENGHILLTEDVILDRVGNRKIHYRCEFLLSDKHSLGKKKEVIHKHTRWYADKPDEIRESEDRLEFFKASFLEKMYDIVYDGKYL